MATPKIFISYSWDGDKHKAWVKNLADRLFNKGVNVVLDQYEAQAGDHITYFMERAVTDTDKVLLILTEGYKRKADELKGGVGFERSLINAEWYKNQTGNNKFIPVLRGKDADKCKPVFIGSFIYIDMSDDALFEEKFKELYFRVYDEPMLKKPKVGQRPDFDELRGTPPQVSTVQRVSTSPSQPEKTTDKEEILKLIVSDIDAAFDKLDDYFGDTNGIYNDLNREYTVRPNNFDMETFRSKLRRFVKKNIV